MALSKEYFDFYINGGNKAMDLQVIGDGYRYGLRVAAIIIKDGKLLTYKAENQNHLVGGAIELGELACNAIYREVKEELGLNCIVKDLMFFAENIFDYKGELHHMIEFHYKVELIGDVPKATFDEQPCEWIPLNELSNYNLWPKFLKEELIKRDGTVKHIELALE